MAFEPLEFTKNWENPEDFPTYEPNEAQVRADLQLLHNEARDGLNRLIAALNASDAAAQLPFLAEGLNAGTVKAAILEVYDAVKHAAEGKILDGTVTKEKLTQDLLDRIYGGRVWVSADTPGGMQDPEEGFPVGQFWLRPAFSVENLAAQIWEVTHGTMEAADGGWILMGDGISETARAVQRLEQIGKAGETVLVRLTVAEQSSHLTALTLDLNGADYDLTESGGLFETVLDQSGDLELTVEAQWPYAETDAAAQLRELTVINTDAVAAAHPGCRLPADWEAFLAEHGSFANLHLPRVLYQQTASGQWTEVDRQVWPVERGGTGRSSFEPGLLLYGGADGGLIPLAAPQQNGSLLSFDGGVPHWVTGAEVVTGEGALRSRSGTYAGDGAEREIDLGCVPKAVRIWRIGASQGGSASVDNRWLFDGEKAYQSKSVEYTVGTSDKIHYAWSYGYVELSGGTLKLYDVYEQENRAVAVRYFNESGQSYQWLALY